MKKKVKIIIIAITGLTLLCSGVYVITSRLPDETENTITAAEETAKPANVEVRINTDTQTPVVYETIIDEETGEEVIAEVQQNAVTAPKPTAPPEKPTAQGSYTNPDSPPSYSDEQLVIADTSNQESKQAGQTDGNKVYVEGFGYVEADGETQTRTAYSDGDINKMVGTMD